MQAIFNRPPSIAEDTVQYAVYPPDSNSDRTSVTSLALAIEHFVESLLTDFLWHRDIFQVKVVQDTTDLDDDEWCVVWLLREVSEKWDVTISIRDSDGEFLLIEAADSLPSWVTPSVAENRVWIHKSHLHLILSHMYDDEDMTMNHDFLNISDALKLAKAYLPIDIAKALSVDPALVQKATEIFYTRDAVQLRAAHKMTRFPPQPCLLRTVRLTRTAYAQLVGQKFYPPKVFGRWQEKEGTSQWRWRDLGLKISCGFEMLYQEGGARKDKSNTSLGDLNTAIQARKEALQRDQEYVKYIESIRGAGYFRGEMEGSQLWNELESKAVETFLRSRREDGASRPSFASQVNAAIAKADDLEPSLDIEDHDDWLTVSAENFDSVLQEKMGLNDASSTSREMDIDHPPQSENGEDNITKTQVAKLRDLASKVDAFVTGDGDVEGAIFEDEKSSGEDEGDFSDERFSDSEVDSSDNEESASAARQDALEKLVPGIDASEYGRMPASFYDRSQRVAPSELTTDVMEVESAESAREGGISSTWSGSVRAPILARDRYEGVDSDDDTEGEDSPADEEEEEEQPQLVGEIEVDMAEEEEEFLEFSRQTLGISDDQWQQILRERRGRGAFVPSYVREESHPLSENSIPKSRTQSTPESVPRNPAAESGMANPNLDSFEAVMRAMDEELVRARSQKTSTNIRNPSLDDKGKGKARAQGVEEGADIETAMDAELKAALEHDDDDEADLDAEGNVDYNLIKNFLESFKSQAGLLQPGWGLPRDDS
ncbi:SGT1 protein-domain-containing protein [Russula vinacea]|nr:SGT1 protein-domain-containing protein [Russula vinacea]